MSKSSRNNHITWCKKNKNKNRNVSEHTSVLQLRYILNAGRLREMDFACWFLYFYLIKRSHQESIYCITPLFSSLSLIDLFLWYFKETFLCFTPWKYFDHPVQPKKDSPNYPDNHHNIPKTLQKNMLGSLWSDILLGKRCFHSITDEHISLFSIKQSSKSRDNKSAGANHLISCQSLVFWGDTMCKSWATMTSWGSSDQDRKPTWERTSVSWAAFSNRSSCSRLSRFTMKIHHNQLIAFDCTFDPC